jgi:hypothetical protein
MATWSKQKLATHTRSMAIFAAWLFAVSVQLFGLPSSAAGWALQILVCSAPYVLLASAGFLIELVRQKLLSLVPAQGGFYVCTPRGRSFVAFEDIASLRIEESLKPARRQIVAVSKDGREILRRRLGMADLVVVAGTMCDAHRAWQGSEDPTPPGLDAACARAGRQLHAWLAATAEVLGVRSPSQPYRAHAFDTATLLEVLRNARSRIEVRAAIAHALLTRNDPEIDNAVRKALGRVPPPLVCAAVEIARPGETFVSNEDMALARPCLAPADRRAVRARPVAQSERKRVRPRLRVADEPAADLQEMEAEAGSWQSDLGETAKRG